MNSSVTASFRQALAALPPQVQARARKQYQLWQEDHWHPSLHFKRVGPYWSARSAWRKTGAFTGSGLVRMMRMRSAFDAVGTLPVARASGEAEGFTCVRPLFCDSRIDTHAPLTKRYLDEQS